MFCHCTLFRFIQLYVYLLFFDITSIDLLLCQTYALLHSPIIRYMPRAFRSDLSLADLSNCPVFLFGIQTVLILRYTKNGQDVKVHGIYQIQCQCSQVYVRQSGSDIVVRCTEYMRNGWMNLRSGW